jgi:hypothetical protein
MHGGVAGVGGRPPPLCQSMSDNGVQVARPSDLPHPDIWTEFDTTTFPLASMETPLPESVLVPRTRLEAYTEKALWPHGGRKGGRIEIFVQPCIQDVCEDARMDLIRADVGDSAVGGGRLISIEWGSLTSYPRSPALSLQLVSVAICTGARCRPDTNTKLAGVSQSCRAGNLPQILRDSLLSVVNKVARFDLVCATLFF